MNLLNVTTHGDSMVIGATVYCGICGVSDEQPSCASSARASSTSGDLSKLAEYQENKSGEGRTYLAIVVIEIKIHNLLNRSK